MFISLSKCISQWQPGNEKHGNLPPEESALVIFTSRVTVNILWARVTFRNIFIIQSKTVQCIRINLTNRLVPFMSSIFFIFAIKTAGVVNTDSVIPLVPTLISLALPPLQSYFHGFNHPVEEISICSLCRVPYMFPCSVLLSCWPWNPPIPLMRRNHNTPNLHFVIKLTIRAQR